MSADNSPPAKRAKLDGSQLPEPPIGPETPNELPSETARRAEKPGFLKERPGQDASTTRSSTEKEVSQPAPSHGPPVPSGSEPPKDTGSSSASAGLPTQLPPRNAPKETLNPRMLANAPATHQSRTAILVKLHAAMASLNERLSKDEDSANKCFVLTADEVITMALDEEEKFAKQNASVYVNVIKLRIVKVTKMGIDEWVKEVTSHLNARYYKLNPIQKPQPLVQPIPVDTGLAPAQEVAVASLLVTSLVNLEEHGYVTKPATDAEIETAKQGLEQAKGWEQCCRCKQRFQVFPGRREDGALTSGGPCIHHPGRPVHPQRKKTDRVTGPSHPYFSCCSEALDKSSGCTKAESHVFRVSEAKRLASILQFKTTPAQPEKGPMPPVAFDCEMGYTTLGMELIRLTAVSWPEGHDLLDILVRPMGEVLDLNTRYSGITAEHYASAKPHGTPMPATSSSSSNEEGKVNLPLQLVQSPAEARDLLLNLLQPETLLIGHSIENDLNVCRIIHPTVIDTALLYPHPKGLPVRWGLKSLALKYLGREIQTGSNGHDSREDSITTGDLLRVKVGSRWNNLEELGYSFHEDKLIDPEGKEATTPPASWTTVPDPGQKRKSGK
ncbi:Exonuclease [Penicillium bovifimosum]|uniref:Exonuclease n=1 Tax=Penicillium bovifimosum TaxID=126998 RepID=A0A9W9GUQ1_9EURO|nr:Exonuclease [Penicillium bovifimosum]KAJ5130409.1 Exonuclease [Penicillium bovifimosum]